MEKARIEVIQFDNADVITTSGGGFEPIPVMTPEIWLSKDSVAHYNAYSDSDIDLSPGGDWEGYAYLAYQGKIAGKKYGCSSGKDEKPDAQNLFEVVSDTDKAGYERVLTWLQSKS